MNKLFLIGALLMASPVASANSLWEERVQAGNSLVNASLSLGYSTASGSSTYFSPRYQYFIFDGLAVGGFFGYAKSKTFNRIEIGPSIRYYLPFTDLGVLYLGQTVSFINQSKRITPLVGEPYDENLDGSVSETGLGFIYMVSNHFGIDLGIAFLKALSEDRLVESNTEVHLVFSVYF